MSAAPESRSLRDAAAVERSSVPGATPPSISDDYTVAGHPNGGYLQCLLANAALAAASDAGFGRTSTRRPSRRTTSPRRKSVRSNFARRCGGWDEASRSSTSNSSRTAAVTTESLVTLGTLAENAIGALPARPGTGRGAVGGLHRGAPWWRRSS